MGSIRRQLTALEKIAEVARRRQYEADVTEVVRRLALASGLGEADTDRAIAAVFVVLDHWTDEHERRVQAGESREALSLELARELRVVGGLEPQAPALVVDCTHRARCGCSAGQRRPMLYRIDGATFGQS